MLFQVMIPGVPWVADEVWEKMTRHCDRQPMKPMANRMTLGTARRGGKPVTFVDTQQRDRRAKENAERLMHDRKLWRLSILESRVSLCLCCTLRNCISSISVFVRFYIN